MVTDGSGFVSAATTTPTEISFTLHKRKRNIQFKPGQFLPDSLAGKSFMVAKSTLTAKGVYHILITTELFVVTWTSTGDSRPLI